MTLFVCILLVPLIVGLGAFLLSQSICAKELMIMVLCQVVVAGVSAGICYSSNTSDVEVINGFVTSKQQQSVSCSHSYSCRCHRVCSGSGKNRTCRQKCDTCYEHSNDWDWNVSTSVGNITIDRIDRRGSSEPPRWSAITFGEPVAKTRAYDNYVKASPGSLFRNQGLAEKYTSVLPTYPDNIYDYYRINRLVVVGGDVSDASLWNSSLMKLNADIGNKKQVNVVVVIVKNQPSEFFYALREAWLGGKKNDVILVVGTDTSRHIQWTEVMTWETNELFKIKLRDAIAALDTLDAEPTMRALNDNIVEFHHRKPMADFHYLTSSITPSTTQWAVTLIIGLIVSLLMSIYFHKNETFPNYRHNFRRF